MPLHGGCVPPVLSSPNQRYQERAPYWMEERHRKTRSLLAASKYRRVPKRDNSRNQNLPCHAGCCYSQMEWLELRRVKMSEHAPPFAGAVSRERLNGYALHNRRSEHRYTAPVVLMQ